MTTVTLNNKSISQFPFFGITLKNKETLNNFKFPLCISLLGISKRGNVVVEFSNVIGNWHYFTMTDLDIEEMKVNRPDKWEEIKSEEMKYYKDQKRKEYTQEEFEKHFELL